MGVEGEGLGTNGFAGRVEVGQSDGIEWNVERHRVEGDGSGVLKDINDNLLGAFKINVC